MSRLLNLLPFRFIPSCLLSLFLRHLGNGIHYFASTQSINPVLGYWYGINAEFVSSVDTRYCDAPVVLNILELVAPLNESEFKFTKIVDVTKTTLADTKSISSNELALEIESFWYQKIKQDHF